MAIYKVIGEFIHQGQRIKPPGKFEPPTDMIRDKLIAAGCLAHVALPPVLGSAADGVRSPSPQGSHVHGDGVRDASPAGPLVSSPVKDDEEKTEAAKPRKGRR